MITFKFLIQSYNFSVSIENSEFANLKFVRGGNIFNFQHQLNNQAVIKNSTFHDIFGGSIKLESYNKDLLNITTKVLITDITTSNINGQYNSFIHLATGGDLQIWNSSLTNIFNYQSGAVIYAEYENTQTQIFNCLIQNNSALNGGVFYSQSSSVIKWTNWTITYNFAMSSGVIYSYNNGYFEFYSSTIANNLALSNPIGEILEVFSESKINNWIIHDNTVVDATLFASELVRWSKLWFLNSAYISQIQLMIGSYKNDIIKFGFQVIEGIISFENSTRINNQEYFISSFISTVNFADVEIANFTSDDASMELTGTTVNMKNVSWYNLTITVDTNPFIFLSFDTIFNGNNISFTNSTLQPLRILSSSIAISNLFISSLSSGAPYIEILNSNNSQITDSTIKDSNSTYNVIIHGVSSQIDSIKNLSVSNINTGVFEFHDSNISLIDSVFIQNTPSGLYYHYTSVSLTNNLQISNVGSEHILKGGAIYCESWNMTIKNSVFKSNKAAYGSAIYFDWVVSFVLKFIEWYMKQ